MRELKFNKGSFNSIIGRIGSGKTSLLLSILGEMTKVEGTLKINGSIAYVE